VWRLKRWASKRPPRDAERKGTALIERKRPRVPQKEKKPSEIESHAQTKTNRYGEKENTCVVVRLGKKESNKLSGKKTTRKGRAALPHKSRNGTACHARWGKKLRP